MNLFKLSLFVLIVGSTLQAVAAKPDPKSVVLRFEQEFKNKGNYDVVSEVMAADYKGHGLQPQPITREMLKGFGESVGAAFGTPTVKVKIEDSVLSGDKVITRITAKGKHVGTFNGIPATNKDVTWSEIHIYRVKDGRIAESWSEVNMLALLTQIGAIPPPPATPAKHQ